MWIIQQTKTILRWCYTWRFTTTIFSATQRCKIVWNSYNIVPTLHRHVDLKIVVANLPFEEYLKWLVDKRRQVKRGKLRSKRASWLGLNNSELNRLSPAFARLAKLSKFSRKGYSVCRKVIVSERKLQNLNTQSWANTLLENNHASRLAYTGHT